jgi:thiamine-phosphate pyrophosphorylase
VKTRTNEGSPRTWRGLYGIVDPEVCTRRSIAPLELTGAILRGGCAVLQLRDKRGDDRDALALARAMVALCRKADVPFVMNDRIDLALLCDADGVHLGQDDLPVAEARRLFSGPIGLSTHDLTQVRAAEALGADVIGFGPVFETATKTNPDPTVGVDGLRDAVDASSLPVVAIGGVELERCALVRSAGAPLAAAIGALCSNDPQASARAMHLAMLGATEEASA